jgi:peptide/nickel transport system substrate-binding protein
MRDPKELAQMLQAAPMSRRYLLQRAAILGVSLPIFGSLLAACADDEDDDEAPAVDTDDDDEPPADTDDDEDEEPDVDDDTDDEPDDAPDDDRYGGRLRLMGHHGIESLHPDDSGPTVTWTAMNSIHEGLVDVDHAYEVELVLATDYEISDDGMTYTISLRDGVVFHDGEPFTSEDVKWTWEWYKDPENAAITAADFVSVDSFEAPDELTVVVNMAEPDASFLRLGMRRWIVASHHHAEIGYEAYSGNPIGTGPFKLAEWQPDDFTLVEAFEDHWDGRPYLDELEVRIVPEGSVRVLELETGGADSSIWMVGVDDAVRMHEEADQLGIVSYRTSSVSCNHFPMNNTRPFFAEREVRQAFMHAIDRDRVIDSVFAGAAVKATGNLAQALEFWYEPDVVDYPYDPDLAREILDDAGWVEGGDGVREKDGVRLEWECLVITGDEARRPEAEMVAEFLSQIGANMMISETPQTSGPMREGTADMALYNWTYGGSMGEPDARVTLHTDGGNNFSHFSNAEMDRLLEEGVAEPDPDARREIYSEVQKLFAEEVPFIYMMFWDWFNQWNTRVQGLPSPDEVLAGSQIYRNSQTRKLWIEE